MRNREGQVRGEVQRETERDRERLVRDEGQRETGEGS